jgi:hypothetical protein
MLSYGGRSAIQLLVCFVALAFISEGVTRAIRPKALRDGTRRRFFERTGAKAAGGGPGI